MRWAWYIVAAGAGFVAGALVAREVCIGKIEAPINKLVGGLLPADSYAYGYTVNQVDQFIRSN
jgi:hypothetical protein